MNEPIDLNPETERRERAACMPSRTDWQFTKSRQIADKFGDSLVDADIFAHEGIFPIKAGREKLFHRLKP
ncbi:MAG: hypothetical protein ABIH03_13775 [Pseudomonadota bacterium]